MNWKQSALLQKNVGKSVDNIEKAVKDGASVGEINNFLVEKIQDEIEKIRAELNKMEY